MPRNLSLNSIAFLLFFAVAYISGCGASTTPPISVNLPFASAQTDQGRTIPVAATLTNDSLSQGVIWSLSGWGSLSGATSTSVIYDAPLTGATVQTATLTATSVADPSKHASIQITVNLPPKIITNSLPGGIAGTPYSLSLSESGGTPPFTWSIPFGAIPSGLSINPATGAISGTPTGGGTWNFEAELADAAGVTPVSYTHLTLPTIYSV